VLFSLRWFKENYCKFLIKQKIFLKGIFKPIDEEAGAPNNPNGH
jgi:hypothetical protein